MGTSRGQTLGPRTARGWAASEPITEGYLPSVSEITYRAAGRAYKPIRMASLSAWFAHNSGNPRRLRHWSVAKTRIICLMLRGHFATFTRQPSGTTASGSMACRLARPSVSRALPPGRTMPRQGPEWRGGRGTDVLPPTPSFNRRSHILSRPEPIARCLGADQAFRRRRRPRLDRACS